MNTVTTPLREATKLGNLPEGGYVLLCDSCGSRPSTIVRLELRSPGCRSVLLCTACIRHAAKVAR